MKEIGIFWDMFPQKDSWLVNSQTCFSIRELQLIMHVDNIRSSSGLCTWMSFRKWLKTELSSALPNFAIEDSIRFSHLLYGRKWKNSLYCIFSPSFFDFSTFQPTFQLFATKHQLDPYNYLKIIFNPWKNMFHQTWMV